jgi:hypothetical protein
MPQSIYCLISISPLQSNHSSPHLSLHVPPPTLAIPQLNKASRTQHTHTATSLHTHTPTPTPDTHLLHSHNALPTLPALSMAAARAFEWLRLHYWEPQAAAVGTPPALIVEPLLRQYVTVRSRLLACCHKDAEREAGEEGATGGGGGDDGKARQRMEKRHKWEASATDLLASVLLATPPLDVVQALVEPVVAVTWDIFAEMLRDFGLVPCVYECWCVVCERECACACWCVGRRQGWGSMLWCVSCPLPHICGNAIPP